MPALLVHVTERMLVHTKEHQDSYDADAVWHLYNYVQVVLDGWVGASGVVCCPARTTILLVARDLVAPQLLASPPLPLRNCHHDFRVISLLYMSYTLVAHGHISFVALMLVKVCVA